MTPRRDTAQQDGDNNIHKNKYINDSGHTASPPRMPFLFFVELRYPPVALVFEKYGTLPCLTGLVPYGKLP